MWLVRWKSHEKPDHNRNDEMNCKWEKNWMITSLCPWINESALNKQKKEDKRVNTEPVIKEQQNVMWISSNHLSHSIKCSLSEINFDLALSNSDRSSVHTNSFGTVNVNIIICSASDKTKHDKRLGFASVKYEVIKGSVYIDLDSVLIAVSDSLVFQCEISQWNIPIWQ